MAKVLLVLYPDPVSGYPPVYARDSIPVLHGYPGGQTLPTPSAIDFTPGELLGCVSGELGLRTFLESAGHQLVVTSDKEGPDSEFEQRAARRRCRYLPTILAGLSDRRTDRQSEESQACPHRGDRFGPRRSRRRDRPRDHRRRGDLLQQHQRRRARRHADPGAGAQLRSLPSVGDRRRLEYRRLRRTRLRRRGHGRRRDRGRPHRRWPSCADGALRRQPALHRHSPACRTRSKRN